MTEYEIVRSKRKSMSIEITREAKVLVRVPLRTPDYVIAEFVSRHEAWIKKHAANVRERLRIKQDFHFADGEAVYFLGERLVIRHEPYITGVSAADGLLLISDGIPPESREQAVISFLKKQAASFFEKRVASFAPRMGVAPAAVTVTSAKTRWGSCSGKNRICFSYRLICMPAEVIDYVVVHELAHILEHNHSNRFYAQIALVLPDYKLRQNELKAFAKKLTF